MSTTYTSFCINGIVAESRKLRIANCSFPRIFHNKEMRLDGDKRNMLMYVSYRALDRPVGSNYRLGGTHIFFLNDRPL